MRLTKRGDVWYCHVYINGKRVQRTTKCHDKRAAEAVARKLEQAAAAPDTAAHEATLDHAVDQLLDQLEEQARVGRRAAGTVAFYRAKAGHLRRVLGGALPLADISATRIDSYISTRRGEDAAETTISKELVTLRKTLKLAKRRALWAGDDRAVLPIAFAPEYKPRKRWLTADELARLLAELLPDRAARVAYIVATSANWSESERAQRVDVSQHVVHVRGTKTAGRLRDVPIVLDEQRTLVAHALEHAEGSGALFRAWGNVRRDLLDACARAGIDPCSPNDLRRTFAHWAKAAGIPDELVARAMGHSSTKMVRLVYGQLDGAELGHAMRLAMGLPSASPVHQTHANGADVVDSVDSKSPEYSAQGQNRTAHTRIFSPLGTAWPSPRNYSQKYHRPRSPASHVHQRSAGRRGAA